MAESPETPETEETTDAPEAAEAPQTTDAAEAAEAPQTSDAAEAPEAPAGEAASAEPEAVLSPKERRARRRAAAVAKRGARRAATPEERAEERKRKAAQRRTYRARVKAKRAEAPKETVEVPAKPESTGHKKVRQGVVVSDKADKTITVRIDVARRHRRYKKTIRSSTTLHVHDERNEANVGDTVRVVEARPLSRTKRWRLVDVLERAK